MELTLHKQLNTPLKPKVFVGLSGGVDSSVAAALLKKAGYDVTGVFIKVWQPDFVECQWKDDRLDAMRVAAHLDIPFITLNLEKEYKREVVDYMIRGYKAGRTPNPDVMCNRRIKFGAFLDWSRERGADYVATGHYARVRSRSDTNLRIHANDTNRYELLAGIDERKDQSYFLWTLTQNELNYIFFPVGDMKKEEVRKLAKKFGLITAEKKDSQGLCFVGKFNMKDFLKSFVKIRRGKVMNVEGEEIGWHDGAALFTLGERHGFTVTAKTANDAPLYVIRKDVKKNTITVSPKSPKGDFAGARYQVEIKDLNWIFSAPGPNKLYTARVRYRQSLQAARIKEFTRRGVKVQFDKPQNSLTPGQSLVLYDGEKVIGGGVIY